MSASVPVQLNDLLGGFASQVPSVAIGGLAMDSRRVQAGDAFVAVRGTRVHGLVHADDAIKKGAAAILWESGAPAPNSTAVPAVKIEKLGERVGEIASRFHGNPSQNMFVAGVTGTDGKTSTAHLIAQAFDRLGRRCSYMGTLGSGRLDKLETATHTTPDPISVQARLSDFSKDGVDACAMEVSSHALDQHRVSGVRFAAVALTNLSRDHLDYHGTVERYAAAKFRLFDPGLDQRRLLLNRDDEHGAMWIEKLSRGASKNRLISYGLGGSLPNVGESVLGHDLELHSRGLRMQLQIGDQVRDLSCSLLGRFNAYNLLAAAGVLHIADVDIDSIAKVLGESETVPGRAELFEGDDNGPGVVVDFAHTPKALEQILSALRAHVVGKLWCVFGCGGDRDVGKRSLMGNVAAKLADRVVVTDDNPRSESPDDIADDIVSQLDSKSKIRTKIIHDRAEAIAIAIQQAGPEDLVLIAGKGHETTQDYGGQLRPFSDREVVQGLLNRDASL